MALETPVSTKHRKLLSWVEEIAELTQPAAIHWCDGSRRSTTPCAPSSSRRARSEALGGQAPELLSGAQSDPGDVARVEDRTFICSRARGRRRPDQQLARPGRDARASCSDQFDGLDARPHDVRRAVQHGPARLADRRDRRRAHRLAPTSRVNMRIMTRMGKARARRARRRTATSCRACTRVGAPLEPGRERRARGRATRRSTSSTSPRRARSGPSARATAATRCWARSASRCASPR